MYFFYYDDPDEPGHRLAVEYGLKHGFDLRAFAGSLDALERLWEANEPGSRLAVAKIGQGSILAEFIPYVVATGSQAYGAVGGAVTISDFVARLAKGIRGFAGLEEPPASAPDRLGLNDLRGLLDALAASGGDFTMRHTYKDRAGAKGETLIEARFDHDILALARSNLARDEEMLRIAAPASRETEDRLEDADMYLDQVSRDPGKARGRTRDKAVVPAIANRPLPLFFAAPWLKERILEATENPLKTRYRVDLAVRRLDERPRSLMVTGYREALLLESAR